MEISLKFNRIELN